ncbi:MAG TPA: 4-hydroxy-tetrahydrodipicolinate synthase [Defluviitaleaceae bacterium]|jgi:4-hydroxy-tetrahydrodipicolinate synthase|nr:4-hydroxy-tetrahydrodipicolinate synthase [Candidatus Epulonipiscium sp.]HOQ17300.1 4-hydroxy-tetrahydrodipicolinate synthase [Defluviitaleaceae bacterium]HPT76341.1 4-hydroxy-tetrahydrodipicolinate synthase [Defluviitaleaceae bacterium]HQD51340.1 4-hydroxy-tetrahydrodipicolinate synthase [Defluviitaleaceae bacterium]
MEIFRGSGVAIVTPFKENGEVNYELLEDLIEFQIQNNTDSIIICGTTGESSTLNDDDHLECIKVAVEKVNKRIPVIAGTGSNDTEHGLYLTKRAYQLGADACLLVTPYYNKTTQKGLIEHYSYIAKNVDVPIILYNVPSRTGLNITPKTAAELSKIDNIVGIKEASGNISQIAELMHLCEGRLSLYSGNDDQIVPILSLGGIGVISVVANIAPKQVHDLVDHYLSGNVAQSTKMQLEMIPLVKALFCEVNPIPVKAALELMGYPVGRCRMPLSTIEEEHLELLKKEMKNYGLIN